jgi:AraC-like DNA-binding protein
MKKTETRQEKYDATVKRFALIYLYIISTFILMTTLVWWGSLIIPFRFIMCILLTIQLAAIVVVHNLNILAITKVYRAYTVAVMLLMFPIALLDMNLDDIVPSLWFIVVPLAVSVVQHGKKFIYWNIATFFCLLIIYGFPTILRILGIETLTNLVKSLYENIDPIPSIYVFYYTVFKIVSIFLLFALVCFCVHYKEKLYKIRLDALYHQLSQNSENELISTIKTMDDDEEKTKYDKLYARIVEYMETHKPFENKDFCIAHLSNALNVNIAYLSAAINMKRNMNFSLFVNAYRIENVKYMIRFNSKKYTLEHIYLSSGFKNQSTFNKAFKQNEGITPTEYINSLTDN